SAVSHKVAAGAVGGGSVNGAVHTSVPPTPDPLRSLPAPDPSQYPVRSQSTLVLNASAPVVLQPGVYHGGIYIWGGTVTLSPGIYVIDGGYFYVTGQSNVVANGVMLYQVGATGEFEVDNQGKLTMSAPTSGVYQGICYFHDRTTAGVVEVED